MTTQNDTLFDYGNNVHMLAAIKLASDALLLFGASDAKKGAAQTKAISALVEYAASSPQHKMHVESLLDSATPKIRASAVVQVCLDLGYFRQGEKKAEPKSELAATMPQRLRRVAPVAVRMIRENVPVQSDPNGILVLPGRMFLDSKGLEATKANPIKAAIASTPLALNSSAYLTTTDANGKADKTPLGFVRSFETAMSAAGDVLGVGTHERKPAPGKEAAKASRVVTFEEALDVVAKNIANLRVKGQKVPPETHGKLNDLWVNLSALLGVIDIADGTVSANIGAVVYKDSHFGTRAS